MNQRDMINSGNAATAEVEPLRDEGVKRAEGYVGRPMERLEDPAILTGRGRYGDDLGIKPGTLHAAILRCGQAGPDADMRSPDGARRLMDEVLKTAPF